MTKIYLFHQTDKYFIYNILETLYILPSNKTKNKNQNPYNVFLPYIFMSCCNKKDFGSLFQYTFIFESNILYNRTFYTNENHSAGNIETSIYYQKNTPLKNINLCLTKLLVYSKKQYKKTFFIFQEIFFKKKVSIYDAKYIILPINIENEMLNKIKNILPYIKIIYK